ncbi:hypothetical protein [Streptomyces sp. NPDC059861]|uniref:hypothetical protein n=1 Tax=Streptomyces sp. NPDC059861 TaxID=3346974 RepID=UPI00365332DC
MPTAPAIAVAAHDRPGRVSPPPYGTRTAAMTTTDTTRLSTTGHSPLPASTWAMARNCTPKPTLATRAPGTPAPTAPLRPPSGPGVESCDTSHNAGSTAAIPIQTGAAGRSARAATPTSTGSATAPTSLTGTTTLIAPLGHRPVEEGDPDARADAGQRAPPVVGPRGGAGAEGGRQQAGRRRPAQLGVERDGHAVVAPRDQAVDEVGDAEAERGQQGECLTHRRRPSPEPGSGTGAGAATGP